MSVKRALLVAASALGLVASGCGSGSAAPPCGPNSSWTNGVPPRQRAKAVRERAHAAQLLELCIVVLQPTYRKAAIFSLTTRGDNAGHRLDPGYHDRRPPQPQPCAD